MHEAAQENSSRFKGHLRAACYQKLNQNGPRVAAWFFYKTDAHFGNCTPPEFEEVHILVLNWDKRSHLPG